MSFALPQALSVLTNASQIVGSPTRMTGMLEDVFLETTALGFGKTHMSDWHARGCFVFQNNGLHILASPTRLTGLLKAVVFFVFCSENGPWAFTIFVVRSLLH